MVRFDQRTSTTYISQRAPNYGAQDTEMTVWRAGSSERFYELPLVPNERTRALVELEALSVMRSTSPLSLRASAPPNFSRQPMFRS